VDKRAAVAVEEGGDVHTGDEADARVLEWDSIMWSKKTALRHTFLVFAHLGARQRAAAQYKITGVATASREEVAVMPARAPLPVVFAFTALATAAGLGLAGCSSESNAPTVDEVAEVLMPISAPGQTEAEARDEAYVRILSQRPNLSTDPTELFDLADVTCKGFVTGGSGYDVAADLLDRGLSGADASFVAAMAASAYCPLFFEDVLYL
jgi:hypothetical protein